MIGLIGILGFVAVTGLIVGAIGLGAAIWQAVDAHQNAQEAKEAQEKALKDEKTAQGYQKNVQKAQQRKNYIRSMMAAGSNVQRAKLETRRVEAQTQALRADLNQSTETRIVGRSYGTPAVRS